MRAYTCTSNEALRQCSSSAMPTIGVTPIPPAMSTLWVAPGSSGNVLRGGEMVTRSPTSSAWTASDPPRLSRVRRTPMR